MVVGETEPQEGTGQVTVHWTPIFELSLLTVAENCAVEPGRTVVGVGPIVTTGCTTALLLPHPADTIVTASPGSNKANHFKLFII